jgi:hypothetical protein
VATSLGPDARITTIEARSATLRHRGFPALVSPDGRRPEIYDYARDEESVHWKVMIGPHTRHGPVGDLLRAVDDRYVITRAGDEIALSFPAGELPPLPPGWVRDYLLLADGFGKDMDVNSARPDAVTPLPYHGMPGYPPPAHGGSPFDSAEWLDYMHEYNSRELRSSVLPLSGR